LQDLAERANLVGLVPVRHRRVWVFPIAQDTEPLEIHLLPRDLLGGIRTGKALRLLDRDVLAVRLSICTSIGIP
jgi:hypothetical protein